MSFMHLAQPCPKCSHPLAEHSMLEHASMADCQRIGCSCCVTSLEVLASQGPASPSLLEQMEAAIKKITGTPVPPSTLVVGNASYEALTKSLANRQVSSIGTTYLSGNFVPGISVTMSAAPHYATSGSYAVTMTRDPGRYRIRRTPEEERAYDAARENEAAVERLRVSAKEEAQKNLDAAVERRKATAKWGDE